MVKFCGDPWQATELFVKTGVTLMVPLNGFALLAFTAVKEAMLPTADAPNPMLVSVLDQLYEEPVPEN